MGVNVLDELNTYGSTAQEDSFAPEEKETSVASEALSQFGSIGEPSKETQPTSSWRDAGTIGKNVGDFAGELGKADKPLWEKAGDVIGKVMEGATWWEREVSPEIWSGLLSQLEMNPEKKRYAEQHPKEYWDEVSKQLPGEGTFLKGLAETAVNPVTYLSFLAGGVGGVAKGAGVVGRGLQAATAVQKGAEVASGASKAARVAQTASKIPVATAAMRFSGEYQGGQAPELIAFVRSQLESDPEKKAYAQQHPKEYWEEVAKQFPGEGFLLKGLAEAAVDPTTYLGFGVAGRTLGRVGALKPVAKALDRAEMGASDAMALPVTLPARAVKAVGEATGLGKLSSRSELAAFEAEANETATKLQQYYKDAGPTQLFDDLKAVASGDLRPTQTWDDTTTRFVTENAQSIAKYAGQVGQDSAKLDKMVATWSAQHPEAAEEILLARTNRASLDEIATRYGYTQDKKALDTMFARHGDILADPQNLENVLTGLRREKQSALGIKPQGQFSKAYETAASLLKETWLPLNVSFHLSNFLDNTFRGLAMGVTPRRTARVAEMAKEVGIPIPNDIAAGWVSHTAGKERGPLSSLPVVGNVVQKGWQVGSWIERYWRTAAWWTGVQRYLENREPAFYSTLQQGMVAKGVDAKVAEIIARELQQRGIKGAADVTAVFKKFQQPEAAVLLGPNSPQKLPPELVNSPAFGYLVRELDKVDLRRPDAPARIQTIFADAREQVSKEFQAEGIPQDREAWNAYQGKSWGAVYNRLQELAETGDPEQVYYAARAIFQTKIEVDDLSKIARGKIDEYKTIPKERWQAVWDERNKAVMEKLDGLNLFLDELPQPRIPAEQYGDIGWLRERVKRDVEILRGKMNGYTAEAYSKVNAPNGLIQQKENIVAKFDAWAAKNKKPNYVPWMGLADVTTYPPQVRKMVQNILTIDSQINAIYTKTHELQQRALGGFGKVFAKDMASVLGAEWPDAYNIVLKSAPVSEPLVQGSALYRKGKGEPIAKVEETPAKPSVAPEQPVQPTRAEEGAVEQPVRTEQGVSTPETITPPAETSRVAEETTTPPPEPPTPPTTTAPTPEPKGLSLTEAAGFTRTVPRNVQMAEVEPMLREDILNAKVKRQQEQEALAAKQQEVLEALDAWRQNVETAMQQGVQTVQQDARQIAALKAAEQLAVREWRNILADASRAGKKFSNDVYFDYAARSRFDEALSKVSPFFVWQTRNIPWYLEQMLRKPALGRAMLAYSKNTEEERKRQNLTSRFENMTGAPSGLDAFAAYATGLPGSQMFWNPVTPFMSVAQQVKEPYSAEGATDIGKGINAARSLLGGVSLYPWLSLPLQAAGVFGDMPYSDMLPQSKLVRAVSGEMGNRVDPEAFWKERMYALQGNQPLSSSGIEDYYINKRLAEMVEAGQVTQAQALRAMDNPNSPLWQMAKSAVQREGDIMAASRFFVPMTMKTLPPGEAEIRQGRQLMPPYSENQTPEQKKQYSAVMAAYPGISSMSAINYTPEKRALMAMQSEYYSLPTDAERRAFLADPANKEYADFYRADSQAKGALTIDSYLANRTSTEQGAPTPATPPVPTNQPPIQTVSTTRTAAPTTGSTEFYQRKAALMNSLDAYYGLTDERLNALQSEYLNLDSAGRTAWRRQRPGEFAELTNLWSQKDALKAQDALLKGYLDWRKATGYPETQPGGEGHVDTFLRQTSATGAAATPRTSVSAPVTGVTTSQGTAPNAAPSWNRISAQMGANLTGELVNYWQKGVPLSPEAVTFLQSMYLADKLGAKSFDSYIKQTLRGAWLQGTGKSYPQSLLQTLGYAS